MSFIKICCCFRRIFLKYLINLFKPAQHIEPIQDSTEVNSLYKYWRMRILYSMFIGYVFFYFTRKSFTFAMPGLMEDLHFDKIHLGILASLLNVSYGISKFTSGIISDRSNPRYFMAFGLIMTGILNICFGLSSSFLFFAIFWGLNGWFQGCGLPPCARFLTHWYSQSERGSWWSTWSVSHNIGAGLTPWIVGLAWPFPVGAWLCMFPAACASFAVFSLSTACAIRPSRLDCRLSKPGAMTSEPIKTKRTLKKNSA